MKNNQSALRNGSFQPRGSCFSPTLNSSLLSILCSVLAYVLASCIFQRFQLWIGNLIYAVFIVSFSFFLGFLYIKYVLWKDLSSSCQCFSGASGRKDGYWVFFSYLIKSVSLKYTTGFCSSQSRMVIIV